MNTITITPDREAVSRDAAKAQGLVYWRDVEFIGPEGRITSRTHPALQLRLAAASFRGESIAPYRFADSAVTADYAVDFSDVLNVEWAATPRRALRAA